MRIIDITTKTPVLKIGNTWKSGYQTTYNDPGFDIVQMKSIIGESERPEYTVTFKIQMTSTTEPLKQFSLSNVDNRVMEISSAPSGGSLQLKLDVAVRPDNYSHMVELKYDNEIVYKINLKGIYGGRAGTSSSELVGSQKGERKGRQGYQISAYDILVPEDSQVDHDKIIWLKDLDTGFILRRTSIFESVEPLLNPMPVMASKSFYALTKLALKNFEKYCMYKQEGLINLGESGSYTFYDTYPDYFLGNTSFLELVPVSVVNVGNIYHHFTSNYWTYSRPTFKMAANEANVKSLCKWPVFISMAEDGGYREDSHIYGMTDKERDWFFDEFDLLMMKQIKSRSGQINLPLNINILNLDWEIQDLQSQVEEHQMASSDFSWGWV